MNKKPLNSWNKINYKFAYVRIIFHPQQKKTESFAKSLHGIKVSSKRLIYLPTVVTENSYLHLVVHLAATRGPPASISPYTSPIDICVDRLLGVCVFFFLPNSASDSDKKKVFFVQQTISPHNFNGEKISLNLFRTSGCYRLVKFPNNCLPNHRPTGICFHRPTIAIYIRHFSQTNPIQESVLLMVFGCRELIPPILYVYLCYAKWQPFFVLYKQISALNWTQIFLLLLKP